MIHINKNKFGQVNISGSDGFCGCI